MRRWLRRVVSPGVRGSLLRDGRERGLHLRGLLPEGVRRRRDVRQSVRRGGGGRRQCGRTVYVHVWWQHTEPSALRRSGVVHHVLRFSSESAHLTPTAATGAAAGQLAAKQRARTRARILYLIKTVTTT